jgi:phosphatidylserine decarboxylase
MADYEPGPFPSFNAFFSRHLREADRRPFAADPSTLAAPCDGLLTCIPIEGETILPVKQSHYDLSTLLDDPALAAEFSDGMCLVYRLCVDNYHRYAYAVSGKKSEQRYIKGIFHTVNPVANDYVPIYKENCREFCVIESETFGTVVQMEVGALMVGRIVNYAQEACDVVRGTEKGRFEFGGSTVVLLLEPGRVEMSKDLLTNTQDGYETLIRMGEVLGRAKAAIDLGCEA